jgi:hypothetical protein
MAAMYLLEPHKDANLACLNRLRQATMEQDRELEKIEEDQLSAIRRLNMMVTLLQVFGVCCWSYVFWDTLYMAVVGKEEKKAD